MGNVDLRVFAKTQSDSGNALPLQSPFRSHKPFRNAAKVY